GAQAGSQPVFRSIVQDVQWCQGKLDLGSSNHANTHDHVGKVVVACTLVSGVRRGARPKSLGGHDFRSLRPRSRPSHPQPPPDSPDELPKYLATGVLEPGTVTPTPVRRYCQQEKVDLRNLLVINGLQAGDLGFEPRLLDPESSVLPLHQSPRGNR